MSAAVLLADHLVPAAAATAGPLLEMARTTAVTVRTPTGAGAWPAGMPTPSRPHHLPGCPW